MTDHHFRQILEAIYHNELKMYSKIKELIMNVNDLNTSVAALAAVTADVLAYIKANPATDLTPQVTAINAAVDALKGAIAPAPTA